LFAIALNTKYELIKPSITQIAYIKNVLFKYKYVINLQND